MIASYKFIQKFWSLHKKIKNREQSENKKGLKTNNNLIEEFTNQMIDRVNQNLNRLSFNVIVANLYEIYNFFSKLIDNKEQYKNLISNYEKILKIMLPIVPHLATECLSEITGDKNFDWPIVNQKYLVIDKFNIVVQINGKKRSLISTKGNLDEEGLLETIKKEKDLEKFLQNKNIIKSIYIKNKLINLIVK
jgi:leucyl-tRNA synthetase